MLLKKLLQQAPDYSYDDLRDLRDPIEYTMYRQIGIQHSKHPTWIKSRRKSERSAAFLLAALIKMRRRGRASWSDLMFSYPKEWREALEIPIEEKEILVIALNGIIEAKRPIAGKRVRPDGSLVSEGTFQVKKRIRDWLNLETGEYFEKEERYLYLRLYVSGKSRKGRSASIYIGSLNRQELKPFISMVIKEQITKEELVNCFVEEGYEGIKAWRQRIDERDEFGASLELSDIDSNNPFKIFFSN